ncbi:unnamed protein product [Hymenolepis diminuta]|uniref:Uncharacterized protein n=1 Tax=Hymenolepis diminuta TaxID=6216 RepID=A0A564YKE7_HYMDI|nr:unnamed protein product [Hymenolepis diminuta]
MANNFIVPTFTEQTIPESLFYLTYEIISQQGQFTCPFNGLTQKVAKLTYDILEPTAIPNYDLNFAIYERIEEPKLEYIKWLRNELMNGDAEGPQQQERE